MEIKELSAQIQFFKKIRNDMELGMENLTIVDAANDKEVDKQDRMGFEHPHTLDKVEVDMVNSALGSVKYGLKQLNEAICELEMAYRRSVRLKKAVQPEEKPKNKKKPE